MFTKSGSGYNTILKLDTKGEWTLTDLNQISPFTEVFLRMNLNELILAHQPSKSGKDDYTSGNVIWFSNSKEALIYLFNALGKDVCD